MSVWLVDLGVNNYETESKSEDFIKEIYKECFKFKDCFRVDRNKENKNFIENHFGKMWEKLEGEFKGCPDLLAYDRVDAPQYYGGKFYHRWVELKSKNGGLRRGQIKWMSYFKDYFDIDVLFLNGEDYSVELLSFWEGDNMDSKRQHMNEDSWKDKKHLLEAYMDGKRGTDLYYPR